MLLAVDSDFSAALHLPSNVNFRRRIVPDQNHRESGTHPRSRHRLHLRSDFSPNLASDLVTVQNNRSHKPSFLIKHFLLETPYSPPSPHSPRRIPAPALTPLATAHEIALSANHPHPPEP